MSVALQTLRERGWIDAIVGDARVEVRGVKHDSRDVAPGDLFFALPGATSDGTRFIDAAIERGAVAVVANDAEVRAVPVGVTRDPRAALPHVAELVYGEPTKALRVVGVTGTNGKTTTTYLLEAALSTCGAVPAMIGTVATRAPGVESASTMTTPEADAISRFARLAVDRGATHLVMEVSSHALSLGRVEAVSFEVAALTNLTHDHLDFHGTFERYAEVKARLFIEFAPTTSVLNVDDAFGRALASRLTGHVLRCSRDAASNAELRVLDATIDRHGIAARVVHRERQAELRSSLLGAHNLENLLVALGCGIALGFEVDVFADALARAPGAPGRLERVPHAEDVSVLVDYAHSPDALTRVLATLRAITPGRVLCVFGCGGDRDRDKRPKMAEAAWQGADVVIATSDNPRSEAPRAILADVERGFATARATAVGMGGLAGSPRGYVIVEDREQAIAAAISAARPGDTVLIAGKGHERVQWIGGERREFDDRVVASRAIAALAGGA